MADRYVKDLVETYLKEQKDGVSQEAISAKSNMSASERQYHRLYNTVRKRHKVSE